MVKHGTIYCVRTKINYASTPQLGKKNASENLVFSADSLTVQYSTVQYSTVQKKRLIM